MRAKKTLEMNLGASQLSHLQCGEMQAIPGPLRKQIPEVCHDLR